MTNDSENRPRPAARGPSVFDRLQKQLDIRKREQGITALDIADLPPNLRRVMRLMLREVVLKYTDLVSAIEAMPAANRLGRAELDSALAQLVEQNWLLRNGQGEMLSYRVNLRRKAGSQLGQDIWSALESKISSSQNEGS
ncbi:MAG: hypothetical protein JXB15_01320 [Anaerolineales bacterium]|nr:hypothetical protein [Anaerolineales bacterium]